MPRLSDVYTPKNKPHIFGIMGGVALWIDDHSDSYGLIDVVLWPAFVVVGVTFLVLFPWGARQRIGPQPPWLVVRGDF